MSIIHKAHTAHQSAHIVQHLWKHLPPLPEKRKAVIAGMLGLCFGGVGLWLYLRSWKDGVFSIIAFWIIVLTASTVLPVVGAIPGWLLGSLFAAGWGILRALESGRAPVPDITRHGGNAPPAWANTPPYPPPYGAHGYVPGQPAPYPQPDPRVPAANPAPNPPPVGKPDDFFTAQLKRQNRP